MTAPSDANVFNTRATFALRPDRAYRVYKVGDELFFIRIGGQSTNWIAALQQFGILGVWIGRKLNARRDARLAAAAAEADQRAPQDRIYDHPHNFRMHVSEVVESEFLPSPAVTVYGPHAAAWKLRLRDGNKWRFQFEHGSDAKQAHGVLTDALGDQMTADVEWNAKKDCFVKRKPQDAMATAGVS